MTTATAIQTTQGQSLSAFQTLAFQAVTNNFFSELDVKETSKAAMKRALKQFFSFARGQVLGRSLVISYKKHLLSAGYSALTACSYLCAVREFFAYCEANGVCPNIAKDVKSPKHTTKHKKQHLTPEQVESLLNYYRNDPRKFALVSLLVRSGLRTAEAVGANLSDLRQTAEGKALFVQGKGYNEKDTAVLISAKCEQALNAYLATRPNAKTNEPLFISESNHRARTSEGTTNRLSTRSVRNIVSEGLKACGLAGSEYSAHSLRHTTAVSILAAGGTIEDVRAQLRHKSISTSQIYVESYNESQRLQRAAALLDSVF